MVLEHIPDSSDASDINPTAVSAITLRVDISSRAVRQRVLSERFDVFVPDKTVANSPKFRFQDPAKIRSSKALNAMQTTWKSKTISVPTNVGSPGHSRLLVDLKGANSRIYAHIGKCTEGSELSVYEAISWFYGSCYSCDDFKGKLEEA